MMLVLKLAVIAAPVETLLALAAGLLVLTDGTTLGRHGEHDVDPVVGVRGASAGIRWRRS